MAIHHPTVRAYRWMTWVLAGGYCIYQLTTRDFSSPGGPFRFLTIWALFLSFFAACCMLGLSYRRIKRRHEVTAMVAAVLNVMVVYLYWKLYFTDPALVNGNGPIVWHQQYYLHGLGPGLQIVDAVLIARAFGRPWRAVLPLIGLVLAYVAWTELFVQRFNTHPSGTVTSGLPYPFLNSMELAERAVFYAGNVGAAMVVLLALSIIAWSLGKLIGPKEAVVS